MLCFWISRSNLGLILAELIRKVRVSNRRNERKRKGLKASGKNGGKKEGRMNDRRKE